MICAAVNCDVLPRTGMSECYTVCMQTQPVCLISSVQQVALYWMAKPADVGRVYSELVGAACVWMEDYLDASVWQNF